MYSLPKIALMSGVLKTWIGNGKPQSEIKDYSIQIAYENGVTSIVKFWEVTNDKP